MKIIQINAADSPIGGASRVAFDLYSSLKNLGHTSCMIVGLKTLENRDICSTSKNIFQKALSYLLSDDTNFFKTDFILDTEEFKEADIINCHNLQGWYFNLETLSKMAAKKPVIWTLHDMWAITPHCSHSPESTPVDGFYRCQSKKDYPAMLWNNSRHMRARKRDIYAKSDNLTIVTPSKWLADKISLSVLRDKKIHIIPNGIDTSTFYSEDQSNARTLLGLPLEKKIILFAANGGLNNGFKGGNHVRELARIYEVDDEIVFVCLGGDEDMVNGNIIYRKKIGDKNTMRAYMNAATLFIFPSSAENFPLVTLEAMACGTPIVSFNVGGVAEAIRHERNGYIAKVPTTDSLRVGIEYIRSLSSSELTTMRANSVNDARDKFSLDSMTKKYEALYESLLK